MAKSRISVFSQLPLPVESRKITTRLCSLMQRIAVFPNYKKHEVAWAEKCSRLRCTSCIYNDGRGGGACSCTVVVVLSSEIIDGPYLTHLLEDISLLHGLGVKFVTVPGIHIQVDRLLAEIGSEGKYVGIYRVTDSDSLSAAMDVSGRIRSIIGAKLSPRPSLSGIRRHGDNDRLYDGVSVATGNFMAAKRRGIVEGIDYMSTGEVKKIDVTRIRKRLDQDPIVLLSNLGYSSSGEALNCNTYEAAAACAMALGAEKPICVIDGSILDECGRLIQFLTLQAANMLVHKLAKQSETPANYVIAQDLSCVVYDDIDFDDTALSTNGKAFSRAPKFQNGVGFDNGNGLWSTENGFAIGGQERLSRLNSYLSELATAAFVCRRVHLLDGTIGGVLLEWVRWWLGLDLFNIFCSTNILSHLSEGMLWLRSQISAESNSFCHLVPRSWHITELAFCYGLEYICFDSGWYQKLTVRTIFVLYGNKELFSH